MILINLMETICIQMFAGTTRWIPDVSIPDIKIRTIAVDVDALQGGQESSAIKSLLLSMVRSV